MIINENGEVDACAQCGKAFFKIEETSFLCYNCGYFFEI